MVAIIIVGIITLIQNQNFASVNNLCIMLAPQAGEVRRAAREERYYNVLFNFLSLVWATYSATSTWCCLGSFVVFLYTAVDAKALWTCPDH